jgi:hypothetical protein
MLENPALWLAAWSAYPQPGTDRNGVEPPRWAVLDPATHAFLGLVRCRRRWSGTWFGWLEQPVVEVFETADESFLFRMWRSWGPSKTWRVADAEGRPVGTLRGTQVRGWQGQLLAIVAMAERSGRWQSPDGRELGSFRADGEGIVARFALEVLEGDPFVRMVLLASLLRID